MPPATAVRLLTPLAVIVAAGTGFALTAVAVLAGAQLPDVARAGAWSPSAIHQALPLPVGFGALAGTTVLILLGAAVARVCRTVLAMRRSVAAVRRLAGEGGGSLVVVSDPRPTAFAVPGLHGRVVVSRSLLRSLDAEERRALLAHEWAHLRHRHHLYLILAGAAAAANPLLRPVTRALATSVERWADETAADAVGDRAVVARSLARAALARTTAGPAGLAAAAHAVPQRVAALLADRPTLKRGWPLFAMGYGLAVLVAAGWTAWSVHQIIETAEAVYLH
jgi:Zn-dependent protease with chaperone function